MNALKNWAFLVFFLWLVSYFVESKVLDESTPCQDWKVFKDEKCFKIIDHMLQTHDDAERACSSLESGSHLPVIHSKEEQDFLANFLFKTNKKLDNFWLGAKFSANNTFEWSDHSKPTFTNWNPKGPRSKPNYCVQMEADESSVGRWLDEPCEKHYGVVCQKMQNWSMTRLQKSYLEARKELRDELVVANKKIANLEHNVEEAVQNSIPIGFIYAQVPNEKPPTELWPNMNWTDISSAYAGVFFRIIGADTEEFGKVQQENCPKITGFTTYDDGPVTINFEEKRDAYTKISDARRTGYTWLRGIKFDLTDGEVRPRNMAIRVWKRIG